MREYFPNLKYLGENVKVELDVSSCTVKFDFKNARGVDIWKCYEKVDLASLKPETIN